MSRICAAINLTLCKINCVYSDCIQQLCVMVQYLNSFSVVVIWHRAHCSYCFQPLWRSVCLLFRSVSFLIALPPKNHWWTRANGIDLKFILRENIVHICIKIHNNSHFVKLFWAYLNMSELSSFFFSVIIVSSKKFIKYV